MMKKKIYILAVAAALAALTACAPKDNSAASKPAAQETAGSEAESSSESTAGSTEGSTASGTGESESKEEEYVSTDETLNEIYESVKEAYGEKYVPAMDIDGTALEEVFGVKQDWYDAFVAEGPAISVHVETFIGVKAKEGKTKEVEEAFENYRSEQLLSSAQYPMNVVKFEAAQIVTHGDYVFFVMLGSSDPEAEEEGEEEALASARANNAVAIDAIEACFNK